MRPVLRFLNGFAPLVILGIALLTGCGSAPAGPDEKPLADAATTAAAAAIPTLTLAWEVGGFAMPESSAYDKNHDVIYVSNINGSPAAKDGNGFISRVSPEGQILELKWIDQLDAPKGLGVADEFLYVSDLTQLRQMSLETGEEQKAWMLSKAKFLNDVAVGPDGAVYLSDTLGNALYRYAGGVFDLFVESDTLDCPNGLCVDGGKLIIATMGPITDPATFAVSEPGDLKYIDLAGGSTEVLPFGQSHHFGSLDGLVSDGAGNYFMTWNGAGKILWMSGRDGVVHEILTVMPGIADIGIITERRLLLVPVMGEGKLQAYRY